MNDRSPKCRGFLGWMLGHKFKTWDRHWGTCRRCGWGPK